MPLPLALDQIVRLWNVFCLKTTFKFFKKKTNVYQNKFSSKKTDRFENFEYRLT